jgi:hypothetical protein
VDQVEDKEEASLHHDAEARSLPKTVFPALTAPQPQAAGDVKHVEPCIDRQDTP